MSWFRSCFGPLMFSAVIWNVTPAVAADIPEAAKTAALNFQLLALQPTVSGKDAADNGDVIFVQPLRPTEAVRTKADLPVHFVSFRGPVDFVVPAGVILVKALSGNEEFFCTSRSVKEVTFWSWQEVGLCLRDTANDGSFDELSAIGQKGWRIRSPYELAFREASRPVVPVNLAYENLPADQIPNLELQGVFYNDGNLLSFGVGTVSLGICWPAALVIPRVQGHDSYSSSCAIPDWESNKRPRRDDDIQRGRHSISLREGTKDKITWGPVSIAYTALEKNRISAQTEAFMPLGSVATHAKSALVSSEGIENEIYVLDVNSIAAGDIAIAQTRGSAP
jgi:hypothetical protein